MFPKLADYDIVKGFHPALSILANHQIPLSQIADSIQLREQNISQNQLSQILTSHQNHNFQSSFHFDAFQVGQYLKKIALQRNIRHTEDTLISVTRNSENGDIETLQLKQ